VTRALMWFRRDLSIADNLAWAAATSDHREVLPAYVFDRTLLDAAGPFRRRQYLAFVTALADQVRATGGELTVSWSGPGSRLWQTGATTAVYEGYIEL